MISGSRCGIKSTFSEFRGWVPIPRAAQLLGWSKDRVRRAVESGHLTSTDNPLILGTVRTLMGGRGRPPNVLVGLDSIYRVIAEEGGAAEPSPSIDAEVLDRLMALESEVSALRDVPRSTEASAREPDLENEIARLRAELADSRESARRSRELALESEVARLRAELAKTREVARLAVERGRLLAEADRIGQEQLVQFLTQDFVND